MEQLMEQLSKKIAKEMFGADDPNFKRIHHYDHYVALQIKDEVLCEKCKTYFEVGTHFGHSLCTLLQSKYKSRFASCDLFHVGKTISKDCKVKDVEKIANLNAEKFNVHNYEYKIFKGNSQGAEMRKRIEEFFPEGIDLLLIDGEHDAVKKDFYNFYPLVNKGGFVVFDDYLPQKHKGKFRKCFLHINEIVKELNAQAYPIPDGNVSFIIKK